MRLTKIILLKTILYRIRVPTENFYMEIKEENESSWNIIDEEMPFLVNSAIPEVQKNFIQKAISQTFASMADLANLLPTGSVLAFQLLSPMFSNQGAVMQ